MSRVTILLATANTAVTTFVGAIVTLALSVLVARTLGPSGKGSYDLVVTVSSLAALLGGLSLSSGITYAVARRAARAPAIPFVGFIAAVVVGGVTLILLGAVRGPLAAAGILPGGSGITILLVAAALTTITVFSSVTRAALAGQQRVIRGNNADLLGRVAGLVAAAPAAAAATPIAFLGALGVGGAIGGVLQAQAIRPRGLVSMTEAWTILRFSLPSYAGNVIQFLNYRLDIFFVAFFRGPAEVGLYVLAGTLVQIIWIIHRSAATALFPAFAARAPRTSSWPQLAEAMRLGAASGIAAGVGLGILSILGIPLVYGSRFAATVGPLLVLLPGAIALTPAGIAAAYFLGQGRPGINARISTAAFVVTLAGNLLLIPPYGMIGAAVASSLSYAVTLVITLVVLRRMSGMGTRALLVPTGADVRHLVVAVRQLVISFRSRGGAG